MRPALLCGKSAGQYKRPTNAWTPALEPCHCFRTQRTGQNEPSRHGDFVAGVVQKNFPGHNLHQAAAAESARGSASYGRHTTRTALGLSACCRVLRRHGPALIHQAFLAVGARFCACDPGRGIGTEEPSIAARFSHRNAEAPVLRAIRAFPARPLCIWCFAVETSLANSSFNRTRGAVLTWRTNLATGLA